MNINPEEIARMEASLDKNWFLSLSDSRECIAEIKRLAAENQNLKATIDRQNRLASEALCEVYQIPTSGHASSAILEHTGRVIALLRRNPES